MPKSVIESKVLAPRRVRLSTFIDEALWMSVTVASLRYKLSKEEIVREALESWLEGRATAR